MNVMNSTSVWVVGNESEGYSVSFSDFSLKSASFRVAHHGYIQAHLEYMQRNDKLGDYWLFDSSDKAS